MGVCTCADPTGSSFDYSTYFWHTLQTIHIHHTCHWRQKNLFMIAQRHDAHERADCGKSGVFGAGYHIVPGDLLMAVFDGFGCIASVRINPSQGLPLASTLSSSPSTAGPDQPQINPIGIIFYRKWPSCD